MKRITEYMKCPICQENLLFEGGVKKSKTDLEVYECLYCKSYFYYDKIKQKFIKEEE